MACSLPPSEVPVWRTRLLEIIGAWVGPLAKPGSQTGSEEHRETPEAGSLVSQLQIGERLKSECLPESPLLTAIWVHCRRNARGELPRAPTRNDFPAKPPNRLGRPLNHRAQFSCTFG